MIRVRVLSNAGDLPMEQIASRVADLDNWVAEQRRNGHIVVRYADDLRPCWMFARNRKTGESFLDLPMRRKMAVEYWWFDFELGFVDAGLASICKLAHGGQQ